MSEYIVTVPKMALNPLQHSTKPILGLSMPENSHTHELYCISSVSRFKKEKKKRKIKKKKKKLTYQPSQFSGQKGKQIFYFCRPHIPKWLNWPCYNVYWINVPELIWLFLQEICMLVLPYMKLQGDIQDIEVIDLNRIRISWLSIITAVAYCLCSTKRFSSPAFRTMWT